MTREERKHKRQQRAAEAERILRQLSDALNAEAFLEDILRRPTMAGASLGSVLLQLAQFMGGPPELVTLLVDRGVVNEGFRYENLGSIGEFVRYLGRGNDEQGRTVVRSFLDQALSVLQDKVRELEIPFGFVERGHGVTRTTYLPIGALESIAPGTQDLFLSRDFYRQQGLDDAAIERIARQLQSWSVRRDQQVDRTINDFTDLA